MPAPVPEPSSSVRSAMRAEQPEPVGARAIASVCLLAVLGGTAFSAVDVLLPPTAPGSPVNGTRALASLQRISFPRPVASVARDQALAMVEQEAKAAGAQVTRQKGVVADAAARAFVFADDVVAVMPGVHPERAARVLIVAHADSVANVCGAGDDGFGVAIALETLRALKGPAPADGDVVVAITGQEEESVVAGGALWNRSPERADVVINLDSGGTQGPFTLYQTRGGSAPLGLALMRAAPWTFASSVIDGFTQIFLADLGDSRTELGAFTAKNGKGASLGLLGGRRCYHAACDHFARADQAALPAATATVLALARTYASLPKDTIAADSGDGVFLRVPGVGLVALPGAGALAGMLAAIVLGAVALAAGAYRRALDVLVGALVFPLALLVAATATALVRVSATLLLGAAGVTAQEPLVVGATVLAGVGAALPLARLGRRRTGAFACGAVLWWVAAAGVAAAGSPTLGGTVGILASFAALAALLAMPLGLHAAPFALVLVVTTLAPCAQVAVVLAMTASDLDATLVAAFGALVACLAVAALAPLAARAFGAVVWLLALALVGCAAAALMLAALHGDFDTAHPRPVTISYGQWGQDAALFTDEAPASSWTAARLGPRAKHDVLEPIFPGSRKLHLAAPVASAQLRSPEAQLVESRARAGGRIWRVQVRSLRGARELRVTLHTNSDSRLRGAHVEGEGLAPCDSGASAPCSFRVLGASEASIELDVDGHAPLDLTIADVTIGLPQPFAIATWPRGIAPSASGERVIVAKRLQLGAR